MKVILESIRSDDGRATAELARDEIIEHRVELDVDGRRRTFVVFLRAGVLPSIDASLVYGDALLEELLRFEPEALNTLYSIVGKYRRGKATSFPLVLADTDSPRAQAQGA